jgi:hypothetical protein
MILLDMDGDDDDDDDDGVVVVPDVVPSDLEDGDFDCKGSWPPVLLLLLLLLLLLVKDLCRVGVGWDGIVPVISVKGD